MPIIRVMHTFMYDHDFETSELPPDWDKMSGDKRWQWVTIHGKKIYESEGKRYVWAEVPAMSEWQMTGNPEALTKDEAK